MLEIQKYSDFRSNRLRRGPGKLPAMGGARDFHARLKNGA